MILIFIRHNTMLFVYVSEIFRRTRFYSQLLQNHCAVMKERWQCTTPVSLNALLYLHETLGEQPGRKDGTKHHIASLSWCSRSTNMISPSRATVVSHESWMDGLTARHDASWLPLLWFLRYSRKSVDTIWDYLMFPVLWHIRLISFYLHENTESSVTVSICFICWE